jgi:hypothetical protein
MQADLRFAGGDPGIIADAGLAIAAAGLTAIAAWGPPPGLVGTPIAGPLWLRALLPLLMGAPLLLRRRAPLVMWIAIGAGIGLQSRFTDNPPHDQALMLVLLVGAYSLGAYASLRRAVAGLVITAPVIAEISDKGGLQSFSPHSGRVGRNLVTASGPGVLAGRRAGPRAQAGRVDGRAERGP